MSLTANHAEATDCLPRWEDEGGAVPETPIERMQAQPNASSLPRLKALQNKHAVLDNNIIELSRRPSACVTELRQIKTQKLRVKDEIAQLRRA